MTISVTPDEAFEPPRNEVTVSTPTGTVMTAVSVFRNDSSGRSRIRQQPMPGFDERAVYDYEAPYGEAVTYDWTATYLDPSEYTPSFTEDWSSYPTGWTGDTGLGAVVSGELQWYTASGDGDLIRTGAFNWQQIEIASLELTEATDVYFDVDTSGSSLATRIRIYRGTATSLRIMAYKPSSPLTIIYNLEYDPDQPVTITRTDNEGAVGIVVSSPVDSVGPISWPAAAIQRIRFETTGADEGLTIGAITAATAGAPADIAEESSAVTLNSTRAWLIHPSTVALSFPLEETDSTAAGIAALDELTNRSATTLHPILGAANPIAVTTGVRWGDETAMTVTTVTSDERVALRALLASDIPILIQVPPAWALGFDSGFYAVGDTRQARHPVGSDPWRQFRLPLTRVQPPIVDVEDTSWTYTQVLLGFATYSDLKAAYATYADLAVDSRI